MFSHKFEVIDLVTGSSTLPFFVQFLTEQEPELAFQRKMCTCLAVMFSSRIILNCKQTSKKIFVRLVPFCLLDACGKHVGVNYFSLNCNNPFGMRCL